MPNQIVLAWSVDVSNSILGPAAAATALGAVKLYDNAATDPVLGQLFGLAVANDVTGTSGSTATRTLTLNLTGGVGAPTAPPPFPCQPRTSTLPVLPYPLRRTVTLPGSFFVSAGSPSIPTTDTQVPSLENGDQIQFLSQRGVFYTVASVGPTSIGLTSAYNGVSTNTGAFKEIDAPVTNAAIYSSSDLDTDGVATVPAIPSGNGAQVVALTYKDSLGAGPFTVLTHLTGRRPVAVALANGSIDIAEIEGFSVFSSDGFGNNVGQITLVSLSDTLPPIQANATPADFPRLTDAAQLLIDRPLAYMPPSYYALAQQSASQGASASIPTNAELSTPLGQFVALETAAPPLNPPLTPSTVPTPTYLSGLYTRTLELALAVPVTPQPITFA